VKDVLRICELFTYVSILKHNALSRRAIINTAMKHYNEERKRDSKTDSSL